MIALILNSGFVAFMEITAVFTVIYPLQKGRYYKLYSVVYSALFIAACIIQRIILTIHDNNNLLWLIFELANFLFISFLVHAVTQQAPAACMYLSVWSICLFQFAFTVTCLFQNREPFKNLSLNMLAVFPIYIPIYAFLGFVVSKKLYIDRNIQTTNRDLIIAAFTHFPINLFNHMLFNANNYDSSNYLLVFSTIFAYACCLFVLYLHRMLIRQAKLNEEIDIINELWQQRQTQYEVTSCNIEFINRKTHDLMHTLTELYALDDTNLRREFLDELSAKLQVYDAFVDTGNRALDAILSQANLYCQSKGITLKSIVDSKSIEFMDVTDLFTILNNALENAFILVQQVTNPEFKQVHIRIQQKGNLVLIFVENIINPDIEISYVSDTPGNSNNSDICNNSDISDFRMKGISHVVQKYDGQIHTSFENDRCKLSIIIPKATL